MNDPGFPEAGDWEGIRSTPLKSARAVGPAVVVRILAFAMRHGGDPVQLSHALCLCFRHWTAAELDKVWAEVEDRVGLLRVLP